MSFRILGIIGETKLFDRLFMVFVSYFDLEKLVFKSNKLMDLLILGNGVQIVMIATVTILKQAVMGAVIVSMKGLRPMEM